jgi:alkylated DNA repair protein alkB family protein 6
VENSAGTAKVSAADYVLLGKSSKCFSLLVSTGDIYTSYLHGIQSTTTDEYLGSATIANWGLLGDKDAFAGGSYERRTRTSLTYRDVIKVSKVGSGLFGRRS